MKTIAVFNTVADAVKFFEENAIDRHSFKDYEADMDRLKKWISLMKRFPKMDATVKVDIHYKKLYFTFTHRCLMFDEFGWFTDELVKTGTGVEYDYATFLEKKRKVWFENVANYPGLAHKFRDHKGLADIVA